MLRFIPCPFVQIFPFRTRLQNATRSWQIRLAITACAVVWCALTAANATAQQRSLGIDVSYWQGTISQATWNNIYNIENREYVFIRASRGGTTGIDQRAGGFANNTVFNGSQRYDDPRFVQNIVRATNAGMFAGPYHFARPDIIVGTQNSNGTVVGVANTGIDEANHFIEMAGAFMRPGYLLPVFDLEAGQAQRNADQLAQFSIDFSNRIYDVMGIRPAMYINGNYSNILQSASAALRHQLAQPVGDGPSVVGPAFPVLWNARYGNQTAPGFDINSIPIQTGSPQNNGTFNSTYYGPWDDYGDSQPWAFWQYGSVGRLQSFNNGNSNLDFNVAQGGIEFVKDQLVPAVWMNDNDGNWNDLANWNSGQQVVAPIQVPGQLPPAQSGPLPTPRLPGAAGSGPTSGQHDTVILERPSADITVTLSSGSHNIRKLYAREALNLTGGLLNINYVPSWDSTPYSARFSAPVTMSGNARLNVHTLHVDATQNFTAGGTLSFDTIQLTAHASPAKITLGSSLIVVPLPGSTATIASTPPGRGTNTGFVDLGGTTRTFTVSSGTADVDLSIDVPITNGGLTKNGTGTMQVTAANTYSGDSAVTAGRMLVNNTTGSGLGTGSVLVAGNGILGGNGSVAGAVTMNTGGTLAPGMGPGTLTVGEIAFNGGSNFAVEIGGLNPGTQHDMLSVTGEATLGGSLNLSLLGGFEPSLGDSFTVLTASEVIGQFESLSAPTLDQGAWSLSYLPDAVVLSVVSGIPGDFNGDDIVDGHDFLAWQRNSSVGNLADWETNFGNLASQAAAATAVPEPGTAVLGLMAALLTILGRRQPLAA